MSGLTSRLAIIVEYNIQLVGSNTARIGYWKQQLFYSKASGTNGAITLQHSTTLEEHQSYKRQLSYKDKVILVKF